jgi:hypothetical protein
MYSNKPTNTGGNAISELKKTLIIFLPKKLFTAITAEIGVPIATDIIRAVIETFNDKKIISYNSTLRENIKLIDFKIISTKHF